jgi:hypothetical protein
MCRFSPIGLDLTLGFDTKYTRRDAVMNVAGIVARLWAVVLWAGR